jgi:hypothetical protein
MYNEMRMPDCWLEVSKNMEGHLVRGFLGVPFIAELVPQFHGVTARFSYSPLNLTSKVPLPPSYK